MANSRTMRRIRKVNSWEVYDSLPALVRAALQEGPQEWDAVGVRTFLRRAAKARGVSWPEAVAGTVAWIMRAHEQEIAYARPWQPGQKRLPPEQRRPSPHLLAQASMQMSNRDLL